MREWWALGAAHVTARDHFGRTSLDWARNASASVRYLLDYGADVRRVADTVARWACDFVQLTRPAAVCVLSCELFAHASNVGRLIARCVWARID